MEPCYLKASIYFGWFTHLGGGRERKHDIIKLALNLVIGNVSFNSRSSTY